MQDYKNLEKNLLIGTNKAGTRFDSAGEWTLLPGQDARTLDDDLQLKF